MTESGGGATNESPKTKAMFITSKFVRFFFKEFWKDINSFLESLIPLFRTFGDVSSDFISEGSNFGANGSVTYLGQ